MRDLLRYRMRQADDSLREASILRDADAQRGAVNRAYYAMFYALLALLATKQLGTSRHSGAISLFDRSSSRPPSLPRTCPRLCIWLLIGDRSTTMVR